MCIYHATEVHDEKMATYDRPITRVMNSDWLHLSTPVQHTNQEHNKHKVRILALIFTKCNFEQIINHVVHRNSILSLYPSEVDIFVRVKLCRD